MLQNEMVELLVSKYLEDRLDEEDRLQLVELLKDPLNVRVLDDLVLNLLIQRTYAFELDQKTQESIQQYLDEKIKNSNQSKDLIAHSAYEHGSLHNTNDTHQALQKRGFQLKRWMRYAAAVVFITFTAAYIWVQLQHKQSIPMEHNTSTEEAVKDIHPGTEGAILTLADGSQVVLDSLNDGLIAHQNGSNVVLHNGAVEYNITRASTDTVVYNTISTPNGRQYSISLPDGTKVWLNAASSITYPTAFSDQHRKVLVTGEVYIEVTPDKTKPFFVTASHVEVQVLGTSFNMNAYSDEPAIKTTLLEGSIKVYKKGEMHNSVLVKPGEQVVVKEHIVLEKAADLEQAMAWRKGVFNLENATLEAFMRQLARWYDIEVIYQGAIPHEIFKGEIGRDLELTQILNVLTQFNIHYKLTGKTITIQPR